LLSKKLLLAKPEIFATYFTERSIVFGDLKYHIYKDCDAMLSDYTETATKWIKGNKVEVIVETRPNSGVTSELEKLLKELEQKIENNISSIRKLDEGHEKEKRDLIHNLERYYWAMFNPTGGFRETLLKSLGFRKCKICIKRENEVLSDMLVLG